MLNEGGDRYAFDKVWITLLKANEFVECRRCYGFNRTITEIDGETRDPTPFVEGWSMSAAIIAGEHWQAQTDESARRKH